VDLNRSALNITHEESAVTSPETEDVVFINHVATPDLPAAASSGAVIHGPTPPGKRVLDQEQPLIRTAI
jgi:hypothetical protein